MKRFVTCALALNLIAAGSLAGCLSDETPQPNPFDGGAPRPVDAGLRDAAFDGTVADAAADGEGPIESDAGFDATVDANGDASIGVDASDAQVKTDANVVDAKAPDASVADASVADAKVPDANVGDAIVAFDAGTVDSGAAIDASFDVVVADAIASLEAGQNVAVPPACDGVIAAGEYGVHANGQNQQAAPDGTIWYMTYDLANVYVAIENANTAEAAVLYLGTHVDAAAGSNAGFTYDATRAASLPLRSDFVAYFKSGYNEYRLADGNNGWTAQTANALNVCVNGTTRELVIPWALLGGHPSTFRWLGYATSATGFVYGAMPAGNPIGAVGTDAAFNWTYVVSDTNGDKPFAAAQSTAATL